MRQLPKAILMVSFFAFAFALNAKTITETKGSWQSWEIDKDHTSVKFGIEHLGGISTVNGLVKVIEGSIKTDPKDITKTEIYVKMDASSLNTGNESRDNHVKGDDFLSVKKNPHIIFRSTKIREDKANKKIFIDGKLKLNGVEKAVSLEAQVPEAEAKMPKGDVINILRGAKASGTINRFDFGINYGKDKKVERTVLDNIKDSSLVIGDKISIDINTEFMRKIPNVVAKADAQK